MSDTIELLEAIGSDALLRHATASELAKVLLRAQAGQALMEAVALGDRARLAKEFGDVPPPPTQTHPALPEQVDEDADGVTQDAMAGN